MPDEELDEGDSLATMVPNNKKIAATFPRLEQLILMCAIQGLYEASAFMLADPDAGAGAKAGAVLALLAYPCTCLNCLCRELLIPPAKYGDASVWG